MLFIKLEPAAAGDAMFVVIALFLKFPKIEFLPLAFSSLESERLLFDDLTPPFCCWFRRD